MGKSEHMRSKVFTARLIHIGAANMGTRSPQSPTLSHAPPNLPRMSATGCIRWSVVLLLALPSPTGAQSSTKISPPASSSMEEIYIARSLRATRIPPTEFCARAGAQFNAISEDQHTFRSVTIRAADGRLTDADVETIGNIHSCNGKTSEPGLYGFYGEGQLADVPFSGIGECRQVNTSFPEPGLSPYRCYLSLSGLPGGYVGGLLTTNTMNSKNVVGPETDPPGYTYGIHTIHLRQ